MNTKHFLGFFVLFVICFAAISAGSVFACTYHSYQQCVGNSLYWYDSCGNMQDIAQYCSNGCYNNSCSYNNNYNNYGNCTHHAYKLCVGNSIYWYGGCNQQQDLYSVCPSGQICNNSSQYGLCAPPYINPAPNPNPYPPYVVHSRVACYGTSLYWYDSLGVSTGLYKNCQDVNACTIDSCSSDKCTNTLKCDGSTCIIGSRDYNTYCATNPVNNNCGNGLCEPVLGETSVSCPSDCEINPATGLSVSFFEKTSGSSARWQKTSQIGSDDLIFFMVSVSNNSSSQFDNVSVFANIPAEIYSLGNLQIDNISVSGDIISGINIGSVAPSTVKTLTFEGKTQNILTVSNQLATATSNVSGVIKTDTISLAFSPEKSAVASVSYAPATSSLSDFFARWYVWIIGGIVLVILFIIIFKRFSSDS